MAGATLKGTLNFQGNICDEIILENVVSDSPYSFQERITSQAFSWHLSRAEQIKEQLYSSSYQVAKKERRIFFCLKTICWITYAFKIFGIIKTFPKR